MVIRPIAAHRGKYPQGREQNSASGKFADKSPRGVVESTLGRCALRGGSTSCMASGSLSVIVTQDRLDRSSSSWIHACCGAGRRKRSDRYSPARCRSCCCASAWSDLCRSEPSSLHDRSFSGGIRRLRAIRSARSSCRTTSSAMQSGIWEHRCARSTVEPPGKIARGSANSRPICAI